ncbi:NAD(P)-dependent oxidoreductase [Actinomadura rugatobispora]|uniref:NAD(P)-dependent oxidoreductase n=1 Tax=Actinomadura rugatobispora TaxID=1994 RepID=A0ABW0ZRR7_9ACTN|nr:SDR family oxidoreductase [Actinomadura rugatobispora]
MHVTVVGATGRVGRHVLDQALDSGHTVTAAVRTPANLHRDVDAVAVDLTDPDLDELGRAVMKADAVISCLGPRDKREYGVVTPGTTAIVTAMRRAGCRRTLTVSGAGVSTARTPDRPNPPKREPGAGWYNRYFATPLARRALGYSFVDFALMEDLLRASDLDWTAVRLTFLVDRPLTGTYRTALERNVRRGLRIGRPDVAHFMVRALEDPATFKKAISVSY